MVRRSCQKVIREAGAGREWGMHVELVVSFGNLSHLWQQWEKIDSRSARGNSGILPVIPLENDCWQA